ncbi:MAG TPA: hypothetical protein VHO70_19860 [Chitinispirillaceae bacterium]|nr:hypothetical protein [Chitinispirillaceae bacterium]
MKKVDYDHDVGTVTGLDFHEGGKAEVVISYSELVNVVYETLRINSKNEEKTDAALRLSDLLHDDFTQIKMMIPIATKKVKFVPVPDEI